MHRKNRSAARRARGDRRDVSGRGLVASLETLEQRSMLAANALDVAQVLWNGRQVNAVRNEYVLRMPQTNAATAKSPIDYASRTPVVQAGWNLQPLGAGFFKVTAPGVTQATLTAWASRQGARYIEANAVGRYFATPNDPLYGNMANWAFPRISAERAWDTGTGTTSTIVAVMDSGVNYNHEDLAANMWRNPNEVVGDGIDNDRNGYIDDVFGINADAGTGDPMDLNGHGTFCAGLIGAVGNNALGMAGVNWSVRIMAISIGNAAPSVTAAIVAANYIAAQKAAGQNIVSVNCSFGVGFSQAMEDAFRLMGNSGIVIAAAAGNDASNNDVVPQWPANFEVPEMISVAASTTADTLADFSNFGPRTVDLAAPGENVLSTRLAGSFPTPLPTNPAYGVSSGTSFAAPLVAGTAALLKSLKPGASASQIKSAILNGADRVAALNGLVLTGGRLNVANSVDLILSTTGAVPDATFVIGQNLSFLEGNVGFTMAEVKVQLDRPVDPGRSASVFYTTQPGGSAFPNLDYVPTSGFLTFSGSETQKSFFVRIVGDRQAEQVEQFAVQLIAAQSRGVTTGGTAQQTALLRILDDDNTNDPVQPGPTNPGLLPQVRIDVKRDSANRALPINEGGTATFVVSLDKTSTSPVTVKYRTNQPSLVPANTALAGIDYVATSGTLTFKPGERTKEFTVRILADSVANEGVDGNADGDVRDYGEGEQFRVVLFEPMNADLAPAAGTAGDETTPNTSAAVTAFITDAFVPQQAPGFQITLNYLGDVPAAVRGAMEFAATRWSQVITGDLPAVVDPETGTVIDDILVDVRMGLTGLGAGSDGLGGVLAQGSVDAGGYRTTGTGLPWKSTAAFDQSDINSPLLRQVALRELGHALGFVPDLFTTRRVLNAAGTGWIGPNALREYRSIFRVPNALNVPMQTAGAGSASRNLWSESLFGNELMTPTVNTSTTQPLSRITVGAMQDLGYTVNYARADSFTRPVAAAVATSPAGTPGAAAPRTSPSQAAGLFAAVSEGGGNGSGRRSAFAMLGRG